MHYSYAQKPEKLSKWAEAMAKDIQEKGITNPILVYRGMSGISAATAISLELYRLGIEVGMFYIRKDNEQSHGEIFTHSYEWTAAIPENPCFIFVDDFIARGTTWKECLRIVEMEWKKIEFNWFALQTLLGSDQMILKLNETPKDWR
jgi:orotate phosphoribosyltransferase-like protein